MTNSTEMNALGVEIPVACNSLYVENSVDRASAIEADMHARALARLASERASTRDLVGGRS